MDTMSKFTFVAIVAETNSGKFFTKFGFVFKWVGFLYGREIKLIISFLAAITLSRRVGTEIDGIFFDWHWSSKYLNYLIKCELFKYSFWSLY